MSRMLPSVTLTTHGTDTRHDNTDFRYLLINLSEHQNHTSPSAVVYTDPTVCILHHSNYKSPAPFSFRARPCHRHTYIYQRRYIAPWPNTGDRRCQPCPGLRHTRWTWDWPLNNSLCYSPYKPCTLGMYSPQPARFRQKTHQQQMQKHAEIWTFFPLLFPFYYLS